MKEYVVYILASRTLTLYVGVTGNIRRRVLEHKQKRHPGFTSRFNINRLLYFEILPGINQAIAREKQIKAWRRDRKIELICRNNPGLIDLSARWYD